MKYGWLASQYLKFRWNCFYLHGIHSPFVFQLGKVIQDKTPYDGYLNLSRFRESVKNNPASFNITDHGAGSHRLGSQKRRSSKLLMHNCTTVARSRLLYRLGRHFKINTALELGTSLGVSAHALSVASPSANITTVEGDKEVAAYAHDRLAENDATKATVVQSTFTEFLDELSTHQTFDLIFIDGHHDGNATIKYFERLLLHSHKNTLFIFDDIRWSKDMYQAWTVLCDHKTVTASIDTFRWGILFCRPQQRQEKFYISLS
jgi:predicted O-methyltransferase YrrM